MQDYEDRERGTHAERLIGDQTLIEAFEAIEANWVEIWRQSPYGAEALREKAYNMVAAIAELRQQLNQFLTDGRLATIVIEKEMDEVQGHG